MLQNRRSNPSTLADQRIRAWMHDQERHEVQVKTTTALPVSATTEDPQSQAVTDALREREEQRNDAKRFILIVAVVAFMVILRALGNQPQSSPATPSQPAKKAAAAFVDG